MPADVAQAFLAEAYGAIDEGKLLRRTAAAQRAAGLDPPMDVQYVAAPRIEPRRGGSVLVLGADILVYEDFEEAEACLRVFEQVLGEALAVRLQPQVATWRP